MRWIVLYLAIGAWVAIVALPLRTCKADEFPPDENERLSRWAAVLMGIVWPLMLPMMILVWFAPTPPPKGTDGEE